MNAELKRTVRNKVSNNAGESLSETLVALLISALALAMLAGAITAASHMVTESRDKLGSYYSAKESVEKRETPDGGSQNAQITSGGSAVQNNIPIKTYTIQASDAFGKTIVAYEVNAVGTRP